MSEKISILVAARPNSKYLAKFLIGFFNNTYDFANIEVLVMMNKHDTWNQDLVEYYMGTVQFYYEDYNLGRAGLHIYFNDLLKHATGDWIIYFCEDHYIIMPNWDNYLRKMIDGTLTVKTEVGEVKRHNHGKLNPLDVWCIVPSFDNAGPMNHVLSRGYVNAVHDVISQHGNLDSYINAVSGRIRQALLQFDTDPAMFHDFTHDHPSPFSDTAFQSVISKEGKLMAGFHEQSVSNFIDEDVARLHDALDRQRND